MEQLIKTQHKTTTLKTLTATTRNNGLHYLFKVSGEKYNKIQKSYTTLTVKGDKLDIDIKAGNGLQLAEPTKYTALDGTIKRYTWTNGSIYKYDIMDIPMWLYNELLPSIKPPNLSKQLSQLKPSTKITTTHL